MRIEVCSGILAIVFIGAHMNKSAQQEHPQKQPYTVMLCIATYPFSLVQHYYTIDVCDPC